MIRFGSMASFASDVLEFVQHVHGDQKVGLVDGLRQVCLDLPSATPPVKALRFSVAAFQVEGQLGLKATGSDAGTPQSVSAPLHLLSMLTCLSGA